MASSPPPQAGARQLLVNWANSQDGWVRTLVLQVLQTRQPLPAAAVQAVYETFQAEKGLVDSPHPVVTPLTLGGLETEQGEPLSIVRLAGVDGVNALSSGQEIAFNSRFTVVFGENAVGKSGYVRILKRVAAVRSKEEILPDLRPGAVEKEPCAKIGFSLGSKVEEIDWHGEAAVQPLTRLGIFDGKAAALHVDADLTYVYTPRDLALFPAVRDGIEAIRARLEEEKRTRTPQGNPFTARFQRGSTIYAKIETLGAHTDLADLRRLSEVSEAETAELPALREKVDALRSQAGDARVQVARGDRDLYRNVLGVVETIERYDWQAYSEAVARADVAARRYREASVGAFEGRDVPGVLTETWEAFIQSGERHLEHLQLTAYPKGGDRCIYCQQPLGAAAVELLRAYREYRGVSRRELKDAEDAVRSNGRPIADINVTSLMTRLSSRREAIGEAKLPAALERSIAFVEMVRPSQDAMKDGQAVDGAALASTARQVKALVSTASQRADEILTSLTAEVAEREKILNAESARLADLEARISLQKALREIEEYVGRAKWAAKAEKLLQTFRGILRSLTETAKVASEDLLNQDFARRFEQERVALRAPKVTLDFPGREGQAMRRKSFAPGHTLSEILSEGEQKAIALADFLAETALQPAASPIVFDDPVTSFDHHRLREVADRLLRLSESRQVVVFTHNIWFAVELLSRFEKQAAACSFYEMSSSEAAIGRIEKREHPDWDTPGKLAPRINELIGRIESETGVVRDDLIRSAYSRTRAWCEAVAEQELLGGVTQRFQPHVRMTCLGKIKLDRLEAAISVIEPMFEKACRVTEAHSQPLETLAVKPTLEELKEDWKKLRDARAAYLAG